MMAEFIWTRPEQPCEIEFLERTPHRRLRHAEFPALAATVWREIGPRHRRGARGTPVLQTASYPQHVVLTRFSSRIILRSLFGAAGLPFKVSAEKGTWCESRTVPQR